MDLRNAVRHRKELDLDPSATDLDKLLAERDWNRCQLRSLELEKRPKDKALAAAVAKNRNILLDRLYELNKKIKEVEHERTLAGNEA